MVDNAERGALDGARLWVAPISGRSYALPRSVTPPAGETLVCSVDGELRRVDEAAIAEHEVADAVMQRRYRAEFERGGAAAGKAAGAAFDRLLAALPGLDAVLDRLAEGDVAFDPAELLAMLTGRSVAAVEADPVAARQAVDDAVAGFAAAPVGVTGGEARGEASGVEPTADELDALAAQIARWMGGGSPVEPPAGALRERARRLFEALPTPAPGRPDPLRRALGAMNALYISAGDDPLTASGRARQQARFHADARARIDEATQGWKAPTPTFDELLRRGRK